jgi:hypothetical protein
MVDALSFLMRPKFDITFLMKPDPRFESRRNTTLFCGTEDSEAETEFYVQRGEKIESITPTAFGTTLDLVWPSPETVPDAIEPAPSQGGLGSPAGERVLPHNEPNTGTAPSSGRAALPRSNQ